MVSEGGRVGDGAGVRPAGASMSRGRVRVAATVVASETDRARTRAPGSASAGLYSKPATRMASNQVRTVITIPSRLTVPYRPVTLVQAEIPTGPTSILVPAVKGSGEDIPQVR